MKVPHPVHKELHRIAVTGIIWRKDSDCKYHYLIAKRSATEKAWPSKWTVPGGGIETDDYIHTEATHSNSETPQWFNVVENTLRREVREEVGVEISDIHYLLNLAFIRTDGIPVIVLSYYCKYSGGEIVLGEDTVDYTWVTVNNLAEYELISGIDYEIKLVEERLQKKL